MIRLFSKSPTAILVTGVTIGAIAGPAPSWPPSPTCSRPWARCRRRAPSWPAAEANKGGHRERAIGFVNSAIAETRAGIDYAR